MGEWCINPIIPRAYINSYDEQEISKEEKELYERFDDTFHKQETVNSLFEAQNKYNALLYNPKNDFQAIKNYNAYIAKILDLNI